MRIIVDAMGGDHAPDEILAGAVQAVREMGVEITAVGDIAVMKDSLHRQGLPEEMLQLEAAQSVITMEDDPTAVVKTKRDSSMAVGLQLLHDGKGDAFVSAANTGALLVGATMLVKRIRGVKRAALATVLPTDSGKTMLMDCGANVECKPEYLAQFGVMGSIYMNAMFGMESPRVGLLNNGAEECKGTDLQQQAYALLKDAGVNFVGNIEGRDLPMGACDVVVADGFTGNVALKLYEGLGKMFAKNLKGIFSGVGALSALFVLPRIKAFKKKMDYKEVGGAPLMGISAPVIKAHGSSDAKAFKSAIAQAKLYAESGMIDVIGERISNL